MKVKELDRTANVAWSPGNMQPIFLAAGTAAQQLDASFSTSAALEIYFLNLAESGLDMALRGSAPSDHRFHKIVWGASERDSGIIVGGCDGGRLQFYSSDKILSGEDGLLDTRERHTGPVRALDFNCFQRNLLATGASESELLVWDLNNLEIPMKPGPKSQPHEEITWVSWNKQVQHILASTFPQRCIMWDLRKNEPIIKLSDSTTRPRWKIAAWHPEVATQLCISSEDDQNPIIQLWDLRFATSPLKVLQKHQRGVLSIGWCQHDSNILASCGKENGILFWNPSSNVDGGDLIFDFTTSYQWNFDVSWCPRSPVLISTSSFDGHVSIYTISGGLPQVQTSTKIADSFPGMENFVQAPTPTPSQLPATIYLRTPPRWLKKTVGASFGFGGKLVMFKKVGSTIPGATGAITSSVQIGQVVSEPELVERSNKLENALQYGQFTEFCEVKAFVSKTPHEQRVWNFMKANFKDQPQVEFLRLLGFNSEDILNKIMKVIDKPANAKASDELDGVTDRMKVLARESVGSVSSSGERYRICTDDDTEGLICQALLLGHVEAAVELCLQNGRMADAIILAASRGPELLAKTQEHYLKESSGYLSSVIGAVVTNNWSQVIARCDVESWKEVLAAILTQVKDSEELSTLCEVLGLRLATEGKGPEKLNAQLCYICAGDLNKLVDSWTQLLNKPFPPVKMQDLVELIMLLKKAVERQGRSVQVSGSLASFLTQYASMLISEGCLNAALAYLEGSNEADIVTLRERLSVALGRKEAYPKYVQIQPVAQRGIGAIRREPFYSGQGIRPRNSQTLSSNLMETDPPVHPFGGVPFTPRPYSGSETYIPPPGQLTTSADFSATPGGYNPAVSRNRYVQNSPILPTPKPDQPPQHTLFTAAPPNLPSYVPSQVAGYSQQDVYSSGANIPGAMHSSVPHSDKPCWNDPPAVMKPTRSQPKIEHAPRVAILHPLSVNVHSNFHQGAEMPMQISASVGYEDSNFSPYNQAPHGFQAQMFPTQSLPAQQQQQQPMAAAKVAEPPKPKGPVPEEHMYLQTVFDELRRRCYSAAPNPARRKLEDVARKLEVLYDALRENALSPSTLQGLHQLVQMVQVGDYAGGLNLHTQLVSGPDFSNIASFMPGLKILLQLALQLQVFLQ